MAPEQTRSRRRTSRADCFRLRPGNRAIAQTGDYNGSITRRKERGPSKTGRCADCCAEGASVKTIWKIVWRDVRRVVGNFPAVLVLVVLLFLPSFYAWFSTVAYMDPYGRTGSLPVAVANEDRTVHSALGMINVGDRVVSELKSNRQLSWRFVSRKQAIAGTKSGQYIGAIVIPSDFTSRLLGLTDIAHDGQAQKPSFDYYVNEEINAVTPKIMAAGASTVLDDVNSAVRGTASQAVAQQIAESAATLSANAKTANGEALGDVGQAMAALDQAENETKSIAASVNAARTRDAASQTTVRDLQKNCDDLSNTVLANGDSIAQARRNIAAFSSQASSAIAASNSLVTAASGRANAAVGSATRQILTVQGSVDSALAQTRGAVSSVDGVLAHLKALQQADGSQLPPGQAGQTINNALNDAINRFQKANGDAQTLVTALQIDSSDIGGTASAVGSSASALDDAVDSAVAASNGLTTTLAGTIVPQIDIGLDSLDGANTAVSSKIAALGASASQILALLRQLDFALGQLHSTLESTVSQIGAARSQLGSIADDIAAISSSNAVTELSHLLKVDPDDVSGFMASPALLTNHVLFPVANYGSSVSPLFTSLALWIGAFMLVVIYKLEVDDGGVGKIRVSEGYLARLSLFTLIGLLQALVVTTGDLVIGVHMANVPAFYWAALWEAIVFNAVIYMLATCFQLIGKALVIVLVMMQIPGAGGMYPIQMMPGFYQSLYPVLPFTYGIGMMREAVGGLYGSTYWMDMLWLGLFGAAAYIIGLLVRPRLLNLNIMIDKKLTETDFFITEEGKLPTQRMPLVAILRALAQGSQYRGRILRRAARFEKRYPKLLRAGFLLVLLLPLVPLSLMMFVSIDLRLVMLLLWLISLVLSFSFIIIVEYLHDATKRNLDISGMDNRRLRDELAKEGRA